MKYYVTQKRGSTYHVVEAFTTRTGCRTLCTRWMGGAYSEKVEYHESPPDRPLCKQCESVIGKKFLKEI